MTESPSAGHPLGSELDADERRRAATVVERLTAAAGRDGFVAFDRFMETALYAEGLGVYSHDRSPLGPAGEFYTAAHVHPLFGDAIAERLRQVRRAVGGDRPFRIVEVGPGDGTLAVAILDRLGRAPEGVAGVDYLLVERSPSLARTSLERVDAAGRAAGIPVRMANGVGSDGPFRGAVLANELLDAMPARRLLWNGTAWRELGVRVEGRRVVPAESELAAPVPAPPLPTAVAPGTVLEFSPSAEALVREVSDHLTPGWFVAVDYGMEEPELLAGHPSGTLAAVRRHRPVDPYESPGVADLSVFVNFSRVRAAGRAAGLVEVAYGSQSEALGRWGLSGLIDAALRSVPNPEDEVRLRLAVKNLLFGFERFRVLELASSDAAERLRSVT